MGNEKQYYKIMGIRWQYFFILLAIYLVAVYIGKLPQGMIGALGSMLILGALFDEIGNKTPIIKDFLGGGAIVSIFAGGLIVYFKVFPEETLKNLSTFMASGGFLDFYIAALICGSIFGMSRNFLIRAFIKYLPLILASTLMALIFVAIGGLILGYEIKQSILYIGLPIMGGGTGAGAVPLSKIFGSALNEEPSKIISIMLPAVAFGNAVAIISAGLLNVLGKKFKNLSGDGRLLVGQDLSEVQDNGNNQISIKSVGVGIAISCAFFTFGSILSKFIPIHHYALMIISVAIIKALNIIPESYSESCAQWYKVVTGNFTAALLIGIGVAYLDISALIGALSVKYIILVILTVIGSIVGAGISGKLLGFYPIEAAITGGLCMANMGGTGDVAVLSACHRMGLMPFAQISSRIGGAFIILLATAILNFFVK